MILAAGFGTRLLPFSKIRPKPLFPILGRPLITIIIERLRQYGFTSIIVNTHHLGDQICTLLHDEKDVLLQVEKTILGTGGGLRMALDAFAGEPVLVVNADLYHTLDYKLIYDKHVASQYQVSMVMHNYNRFNKVLVNKFGRIVSFSAGESALAPTDELLAFTGVHVVNPEIITPLPLGRFSNIIDHYTEFIKKGGAIQSIKMDDPSWRDIGTPSDYLDLHRVLITENKEIDHLKPILSSNFYADDAVVLGKDVTMAGWGMIGSGAEIGDNSHLERVVIWDGAVVEEGSICKDTIIC